MLIVLTIPPYLEGLRDFCLGDYTNIVHKVLFGVLPLRDLMSIGLNVYLFARHSRCQFDGVRLLSKRKALVDPTPREGREVS